MNLVDVPADVLADRLYKVMHEVTVIADAVDAISAQAEDLPFPLLEHVVVIHHAIAAARKVVAS